MLSKVRQQSMEKNTLLTKQDPRRTARPQRNPADLRPSRRLRSLVSNRWQAQRPTTRTSPFTAAARGDESINRRTKPVAEGTFPSSPLSPLLVVITVCEAATRPFNIIGSAAIFNQPTTSQSIQPSRPTNHQHGHRLRPRPPPGHWPVD